MEKRIKRNVKSTLQKVQEEITTKLAKALGVSKKVAEEALEYLEEHEVVENQIVVDEDALNDEIELGENSEGESEDEIEDTDNTNNHSEDNFCESPKLDFKKLGDSPFSTRTCLRLWALRYGLPRDTVDGLLDILVKKENLNLPLSQKTLVATPTEKIVLQPMKQNADQESNGEFYYFGIQNQIKSLNYNFLKNPDLQKISFEVGIDGFSPFKASNIEIWPVLMSFSGQRNIPPFMVAAYCGKGKPMSSEDFLSKFVEEINCLVRKGGIEVDEVKHIVKPFDIHHFGCDAPAKSFVKRVQGHTGHNSCNFCNKMAESIVINEKTIKASVFFNFTKKKFLFLFSDLFFNFKRWIFYL
jgi:hypothetical protein